MARILVVDDEEDMANVIRLVLESDGHEVRVELAPEMAVEVAKEFAPELVLTDLVMPGMDGHQVFRALRELPDLAAVPFVFLTSRNKPIDLMVGLHVMGAADYITKPFDRPDLVRRVRKLLDAKN
ncbi:MAG TPA: response regulator [Fibrobacteria bacterium]|nr:response regulator [Fibrobacteria bacterium]